MKPTEKQIEAVARKLAVMEGFNPDDTGCRWDDETQPVWKEFTESACDILEAALSVEAGAAPVASEPEWWQVWNEDDQDWKIATAGQIAMPDDDFKIRPLYTHPAPAPAVEGWRPIATAPKDKTRVLVAVPDREFDGFTVGEAYFDPDNFDGDWWWAGTSAVEHFDTPISDCMWHEPSHWMPLPAAPAAPTAQMEGE